MTIRRVGSATNQPTRRSLGHLDVNIDDLRALIELLAVDSGNSATITVEFDEGEFDAASDMRGLSDTNLRWIRVKSDGVVVLLSVGKAEAIGTPEGVEFVYNSWARSRQSRFRPPTDTKFDRASTWVVLILTIGLVVMLGVMAGPSAFRANREWVLFAMYGLIGFGAYIMVKSNKIRRESVTYARLLPLTADEIRKQVRDREIPRWAFYISILALAASLAFNIISLLVR